MRDPITVITTVRDGEAFLDRYFDNLGQILGPHDHAVIVDDGSRTPLITPKNWQNDPRLTILHPGKIGRGAALNLAIENSPTDLIAIQDIDDISLPERLDRQVDILTRKPNQLVFAQAASAPWRPTFGKAQQFAPSRLYVGNPLHHSSLAMNRSLWIRAGGYATDLPCCIDLDFYLRTCCLANATMRRLNTRLIERNFRADTRHFARIPDAVYRQTRTAVLARYRAYLSPSIWMTLAKFRNFEMFVGKDIR
ncbi:glycosyltransferase family A protein [Thalassospira sp. HJ]|uniref:glycosyltransferase family 2 protein n=1 Tax=Thalassospira sp. HJ TaxID=1616823 RepID=UPI000695AF1E|nr:glycosyltransferase family A protein [Thalassospira sp. HJ]